MPSQSDHTRRLLPYFSYHVSLCHVWLINFLKGDWSTPLCEGPVPQCEDWQFLNQYHLGAEGEEELTFTKTIRISGNQHVSIFLLSLQRDFLVLNFNGFNSTAYSCELSITSFCILKFGGSGSAQYMYSAMLSSVSFIWEDIPEEVILKHGKNSRYTCTYVSFTTEMFYRWDLTHIVNKTLNHITLSKKLTQ